MRKIFCNVDLEVNLLKDKDLGRGALVPGMLGRQGRAFRFSECGVRRRNAPLPRVFEGKMLTMVVHKDKSCQLYLKQLRYNHMPDDPQALAQALAQEAEKALRMIADCRGNL